SSMILLDLTGEQSLTEFRVTLNSTRTSGIGFQALDTVGICCINEGCVQSLAS
ncbi:mCG113005, isoform CRA_a, partial [Mus musculus]